MRSSSTAKEDQMLLAYVEDKFRQASQNYMMTSTSFIDLRQRTLVSELWHKIGKGQKEIRLMFVGGYDQAERTMACFVPDYEEQPAPPLCIIRALPPAKGRKLSHRDYLGSLTGLGLKREVIGDILAGEDSADIVVLSEISDFLMMNYSKAGRTSFSVELHSIDEIRVPELRVKEIRDTVASLRLDSIVASAFGISRSSAAEAIRKGLVYVNSMQTVKTDMQVNEEDRIVLRGKGKACLREVGARTRKDRIFVGIERYL